MEFLYENETDRLIKLSYIKDNSSSTNVHHIRCTNATENTSGWNRCILNQKGETIKKGARIQTLSQTMTSNNSWNAITECCLSTNFDFVQLQLETK